MKKQRVSRHFRIAIKNGTLPNISENHVLAWFQITFRFVYFGNGIKPFQKQVPQISKLKGNTYKFARNQWIFESLNE